MFVCESLFTCDETLFAIFFIGFYGILVDFLTDVVMGFLNLWEAWKTYLLVFCVWKLVD